MWRPGLARDRRGATVVEFALVGSAFFTVVLLLMEACWQVAVTTALDAGAREAARWAGTGQVPPAGSTATGYVSKLILTSAGMPLSAASLSVEIDRPVLGRSSLEPGKECVRSVFLDDRVKRSNWWRRC